MKFKHLSSLLLTILCPMILSAQTPVWQIGQKDGAYKEFAMAEKKYSSYLTEYPEAISVQSVGNDKTCNIPYFLPGPLDNWAGNSVGRAILRFGLKGDVSCKSSLVIDFVETHPYNVPVLEIKLNGFTKKVRVPAGSNQDYLDNRRKGNKELGIKVDFPENVLKEGSNTLQISTVSGSWLVFDDIRLEADKNLTLTKSVGSIDLIGVGTEASIIYGPQKQHQHPIKITAANWSKKAQKVKWNYDGKEGGSFILEPGINTINTGIPEGYAGKEVTVSLECSKAQVAEAKVNILPAEEWTIYLVQHTHTDIGYTKPQTEILTEHLRYIDYAVEYCDATADYPDESQFRWTCEASWAVREWLRVRPQEQIDKFLKYVKEGRIEVTAMFFNMSELSGENNYKTFLEPVAEFHKNGIEVVTAMQNDVNGIAWCLADYLPQIGVKYMTIGSNSHRADIPFDRPTVYWWESPAGSRVMSYRTDHYHTGNFWGLHNGQMESIERNVFSYIRNLKSKGYPFKMATVQYSGYHTDNSPPSMMQCDAIKEWNEIYVWPKIKSATAQEFLREIETRHSEELPVIRAAYPDWWTDGFGSAARESAASRKTQSDMITVSGMLSMAAMEGDKYISGMHEDVKEIHEDLLFYDEHTFGAAESIRNPGCENSQVQWAEKGSYAWEALKSTQMMYETAAGRLQGRLYRSSRPTLTFFNPLGWNRSSLSKVYIDFEIVPDRTPFNIVDENGKALKLQPVSTRKEGRYYLIWAEDIPAMGYRTYEIVLGEGTEHGVNHIDWESNTIENDFYRLCFDKDNGGLKSLYDKELEMEIHDAKSEWNFGSLIYESLEGDRNQMERKVFEKYRRSGLRDVRFTGAHEGDIFTSITFTGKLEGCSDRPGINVEFRLYNNVKRIEMCYSLTRNPETDPSGIYVSFPIDVKEGKLKFDVPGGLLEAGVNQLPRSSTAWNTVQNFVSAQNDQAQVVISTDAIPLFMMGEMLNDPYRLVHKHDKTHVFSWIMNNYWTTNFRASQEGELKWNYVMTSMKDNTCSDATLFGWENRVPLYARVIPGTQFGNNVDREKSYMSIKDANILMASCIPSLNEDKAILVNIRETDGKASKLVIYGEDGQPLSMTRVNVLDEPLAEPAAEIELIPYENIFVRVRK